MGEKDACCSPSLDRGGTSGESIEILPGPDASSVRGMVKLKGGTFSMGSEGPEVWPTDAEGPVRAVTLPAFRMNRCAVTNQEFGRFVEATGYVTEAERFGWSLVFFDQIPASHRKRQVYPRVEATPWWWRVDKADWRRPGGPGTNLKGLADHPVVHVSWADAEACATWMGRRLPTEAEWEYASRGGLQGQIYPWGNELVPGGEHHCNIWQGSFPEQDRGEDGFAGTAPVRSFPPNGFGLHQMVGNVWEWCADWFRDEKTGTRSMRGGSFLCHASYCNRYRNSARTGVSPDSTTSHLGFRLAKDL